MDDDELREAIIKDLRANRTTGAGGNPLNLSDANLATRLGCDLDQLNVVLAALIKDGVIHGKPRRVLSSDSQMEWDLIRLKDDPLPSPDPRELD